MTNDNDNNTHLLNWNSPLIKTSNLWSLQLEISVKRWTLQATTLAIRSFIIALWLSTTITRSIRVAFLKKGPQSNSKWGSNSNVETIIIHPHFLNCRTHHHLPHLPYSSATTKSLSTIFKFSPLKSTKIKSWKEWQIYYFFLKDSYIPMMAIPMIRPSSYSGCDNVHPFNLGVVRSPDGQLPTTWSWDPRI